MDVFQFSFSTPYRNLNSLTLYSDLAALFVPPLVAIQVLIMCGLLQFHVIIYSFEYFVCQCQIYLDLRVT